MIAKHTRLASWLMAAALVACSSGRHPLETVSIVARSDANRNTAVAVDVVLVTESGLGEQLAKLKAADWFKRRQQFLRDHPDGLKVLSWELVPGQSAEAEPSAKVADAFVFANYADRGDHRIRLSADHEDVRVFLDANDVTVDGADSLR